MSAIAERLRMLPDRSGVYLFRDLRGQILYVGKAKRLHLRVRSYFQNGADLDQRLANLVERTADIDTIVTDNEIEALILEANLVKRHKPHFNIELKDDKKYPYLKVSLYHRFPGLFLTRSIVGDGSRYFGPYTHVKNLRQTLKTLRKVFPLRNCTDRRVDRDERECLEYFIDRCPAPCTRRIEEDPYGVIVRRLVRFLEGDVHAVVDELREQMLESARERRFEESARLRDAIETLERLVLQQRMTPSIESDADVVAIVGRGDKACGVVVHVRDGKVLGKDHRLMIRTQGCAEAEILRTFLLGTYGHLPRIPAEIVTSSVPPERGTMERWLHERAEHPVRIRVARGETWRSLLRIARENAHLKLEEEELKDRKRRDRVDAGVYDLQERLDLPRTPYRIEGFDISNLQSTHPVASRVTFRDGIPLKSGYRRFRMKQTEGPDDVAMIGEVLLRRARRLKEEDEEPPDLILVDGGKGQVGRAADVLKQEGLGEIQLLGLAKREELVVIPGIPEPIRLPRTSEGLRLLQRVRDEAHRFAVGYHRKLRRRAQTSSAIDSLPGIGPKRRRLLLRQFGSLEGIRRASPESLCRVEGIGPRTAKAIVEHLRATAAGEKTKGELS